jgi:spoIIIJ-associated protein
MRSVEASAKTRQEAIKKALDMLGVELHEVEIEILDEGSRGLFGLGAREVKVRVTAEGLPDEPKPKRPERHERHERAGGERREGGEERRHGRQGKPGRQERPPKQERPAAQQERTRRPEKGVDQQVRQKAPAQERPAQEKKAPREERPEETKAATPIQPITDARREEAAALLAEVITKMGLEVTVTSEATEDGGARINVDSPDSALLIGRKGRNLESLQYLANRMMSAGETSETSERFVVDIEHYLDRRRQSLEEMARQLALKAKETGRDVRVKPLSPQERRIIHMTLQDDPDVRTFSLGTATMRHVVISPKNAQRDAGGSRRGHGGSRDSRQNGRPRGKQRRGMGRGGSGRQPQGPPPQEAPEVQPDTD